MNIRLFSIVLLIVLGCKKQDQHLNLSSQQIWDSIGFKYEKKYRAVAPSIPDTIIFHSDNSVTEYANGDSVLFHFNFVGSENSVRRYHPGFPIFEPEYFSFEKGMGIKIWSVPDTIPRSFVLHYFLKNDTGFMGGVQLSGNQISVSFLHPDPYYVYTIFTPIN